MMMNTVLTNQFQFMRGVGSKYISLFFMEKSLKLCMINIE